MHKSERLAAAAEQMYRELQDAGYEVLFDDRKERPGVIFADIDLMGIPHRIVLSERGLDAGSVEYKGRRDPQPSDVAIPELTTFLRARGGHD